MPSTIKVGVTDGSDPGELKEIPNDSPRIPRSVISRMRRESEDVLSISGERISEPKSDSLRAITS